jgi:hypothetical protein
MPARPAWAVTVEEGEGGTTTRKKGGTHLDGEGAHGEVGDDGLHPPPRDVEDGGVVGLGGEQHVAGVDAGVVRVEAAEGGVDVGVGRCDTLRLVGGDEVVPGRADGRDLVGVGDGGGVELE